jgi:hypothetical protein
VRRSTDGSTGGRGEESILQIGWLRRSPKSIGSGRAQGGGGGDGVGVLWWSCGSYLHERWHGEVQLGGGEAKREEGGGALRLVGTGEGGARGGDRLPGASGAAVGGTR